MTQLRLSLRSILRNKTLFAINVGGLAVGMASVFIILTYLRRELRYDRQHEYADRIVRVLFRGVVKGEKMNEASVMPPVAQTLKADYPEVEQSTRLREAGRPVVRYGQTVFREERAAYVDPNFFEVFTLPMLKGDAVTALRQPHTLILSRAAADKYFGKEEPVGKTLEMEGWPAPCTVVGVMENIPDYSHFHFDILASMAGLEEARSDSWMSSNFFTYLVLAKGTDYKKLEAKLPQTIDKYIGPQLQQGLGMSLADFRKQGNDLVFALQPLTDIHLSTEIANPLAPNGNIQYVYMFSAVAAFLLLIACINFMNLSTANAARRAREVGVRKAIGVSKNALVRQFLGESLLLTAFAMCLAIGLAYAALPMFSRMLDVQLSADLISDPRLLAGFLGVGLITGLLAGSYPAFFLSGFNPVAVLKQRVNMSRGSVALRSGLVVFQFCISTVLIIGTLIVHSQLSYIRNKPLGYDKNQVLILPDMGPLGAKTEVFKQRLAQNPRVRDLSVSGFIPVGESFDNNFFVSTESRPEALVKTLRYEVDERYIPVMGMNINAGRNFADDLRGDSAAVILNEAAAHALGFGKDALGQRVVRALKNGNRTVFTVVGVVQDFHFRSLHEPISPLVMTASGASGNLIVKAEAGDMAALVSAAQASWKELAPNEPFRYSFLDERFERSFVAEQRTGLMLGIFAALTIGIACLGLFGLALFTMERRTKEIGIRKTLGASTAGITQLLTREFLRLVLIALLIASPIAYFLMQRWLADFAYRIEIQWWMFAAAGLGATLVALLTVGFQSVKAAQADPVKSLRSE